ncbi:MAG: TetR family transcriptional regulator [Acidimicrobiia bacterium]
MATRDPEATKAKILDAALHEFSANGIAGARVDAIAARAKVNKRMLYYYFGSKEDLFREILRRRLHERTATLHERGARGAQPMAERATRAAADAEYTRLLMWEALETKPSKPVNEEIRRSFFDTWVGVVREEQAAGKLPADLDAQQLVLTEVLLVLGPLLLPQVTHLVTGHVPTDPEFVAARSEFLEHLEARISAR